MIANSLDNRVAVGRVCTAVGRPLRPLVETLEGRVLLSGMPHLIASDAHTDDQFGDCVAIDGDTAIVGAVQGDAAAADTGAAYIYQRSGSGWSQVARLTAADPMIQMHFGSAVAIDGDYAVVGAENDAPGSLAYAGSAYVFQRSGSSWTQIAKLAPSDPAAWACFGSAVAMSGDRIVIGAPRASTWGASEAGAAYIYQRIEGEWTQVAKLSASDTTDYDRFGQSVSIWGDTAIVGAGDHPLYPGSNTGAAYVFQWNGLSWAEAAKLSASEGEAYARFGYAVSVCGDTAVVGAPFATNGGKAYIFHRGASAWSQVAMLTGADQSISDYFGHSVAIDGTTVVAGAYRAQTPSGLEAGSAYIFRQLGSTWTQTARLTAPDGAQGDWFGFAVALSGSTAIVGATYDDTAAGANAGSAWISALQPDLVVGSVTYAAGTFSPGDAIVSSGIEREIGGVPTGAFYLEARLSTDRVWGNADDVLLMQFIDSAGLAASGHRSYTGPITVPAATPSGTYYVAVKIDSTGAISESDETNNVWWSAAPDVNISPDRPLRLAKATYNDLAYDAAGRLYMAYYDSARCRLCFGSRSPGGTWQVGSLIDGSSPDVGQYISLAIDSRGRPGVAYYDAYNADLRYAHYSGSGWDVQSVDSRGATGMYPSLRFDSADQPIISYYYKRAGDLRLAYFRKGAWSIQTIDSGDDCGRFSSLAAAPSGGWAIAYENTTQGLFRYAAQSSSGWRLATVDDTLAGGGYISLAFDPQGHPAFSYYDAFNADLKFARHDGNAWLLATVASRRSQGLYSRLSFDPADGAATILYFNKTQNAVFCAKGDIGAWAFTTMCSGGGRHIAAAVLDPTHKAFAWYEDSAAGLTIEVM